MVNPVFKSRSKDIRLVATDIDGVWTDAGMIYSVNGELAKIFSTYDGMAVQLLREAGIPVAILTGEDSQIVARRAEKLKIPYVYLGEQDKLQRITYLCARLEISLSQVAYIGDDLNDMDVLKVAGLSATPSGSPILSTFSPHLITKKEGGKGAFREFVDTILAHR